MVDNLRVLILAAGKSTRMKSKYAKVLHRTGGATLIEHVLRAARSVSTDITIVIGHSAEKVRELLPESRFVEQKEQLGTGHAVQSAHDAFKDYSGNVLILPGDVPLVSPKTLETFPHLREICWHRDRAPSVRSRPLVGCHPEIEER